MTKSIILIFIMGSNFVFSIPKVVEIPYFRNDWNKIDFLEGAFYIIKTDKTPENNTKVKLSYDKKCLYIKIICEEKKIENVVQSYTGPEIWKNDCVEIFIDTNLDRKTYYQFIISVDGQIYGWDTERTPILKDWSAFTKKGKDYWETEIKIPFSILNISLSKGEIIGMTFCRERWAERLELSTWTPPIGFHRPKEFSLFIFGTSKDVMNKFWKIINGKLEILNKEKGNLKISEEIEEKINLLSEFSKETQNYLTDASFNKENFIRWLEKFERIKNSVKIDEIIYEIKIEKLLSK